MRKSEISVLTASSRYSQAAALEGHIKQQRQVYTVGQDESLIGRGLCSGALYKACSLPEPIVIVPGVVYIDGATKTWLPKRQATQGVSVDGNENSLSLLKTLIHVKCVKMTEEQVIFLICTSKLFDVVF